MQRLPGGQGVPASIDPLIALGLDALPAASVMIFDRDLVFRLVRGTAVRDQGVDPASLEGRAASEALGPQRWAFYEPLYRKALEGEASSIEIPGRSGIGFYRVDVAPVRDAAGTVIGGSSVAVDITEARRLTDALADSEQRLHRTMQYSPVGIVLVNADGRFLDVNESFARMLGYAVDDIIGRTILDITEAEDAEPTLAAFSSLVTGEQSTAATRKRYRRADGSVVWADVSGSRVSAEDGSFLHNVVVVSDVTTEMEQAEALRLSEDRFRLLAENASDVVYMATRDGTMLWVSPSARPVLGRTPESMVGHRAEDFVHPGDVEQLTRWRDAFYAGTLEGESVLRWPTPRGVREMSLVVHGVDLPDGPGAVIGLHDITDAQQARRALARSEERFRLAMAAAPIGMAISDASGSFREVNEALQQLLGADEAELIGRSVSDFLPPEEAHLAHDATEQLHDQGHETMRHEHRLINGDRSVWVEHAASVMRGDDGQPQFYVHQFVDRTEAYELRRDLEFRASHDALTGVINRGELMRQLDRGLRRAQGTASWLGVLFVDVDNLKTLNDEHGHGVGDAAIRAVADRLASAVRAQDLVARIGGDEFVVLLERLHHREELAGIAEKLLVAVSGPLDVEGRRLELSVSVGAVLAGHDEGPDAVLARADHGLLRAKAAGRRQVDVD